MRRLPAAVLAALTLFSLAACGERASFPQEEPASPVQEEPAVPELEPERENLTPERKDWKQMTVRERLAAASQELAAENATRQHEQPHRKPKDRGWER